MAFVVVVVHQLQCMPLVQPQQPVVHGLADRDQPPQPIDLVDVEMDKWSGIWTTHPMESVPDLTGLPGYRVPEPPTAEELVAATSRFVVDRGRHRWFRTQGGVAAGTGRWPTGAGSV